MKTFNHWLATASPAIQSLPEMTARAIFEAGQDNPSKARLGNYSCMITDNNNYDLLHDVGDL